MRQLPLLLVMVTLLAVALLALATAAIAAGSVTTGAAASPLTPPMILPGGASTSSSAISGADSERWIIGAKPGNASRRIAEKAGAGVIDSQSGIYTVAREAADSLAGELRRAGLLVYAEPDAPAIESGYPAFSGENQWWLNRIVDTVEVTPPPVTPNSPQLGLVEESLDPTHPDLVQANLRGALSIGPDEDNHGTAVAAIAGSPGGEEGDLLSQGIVGVWPGMNMTLFPSGTTCVTATKAVLAAARAKVAVINMSYGFPYDVCFSHYVATETAVRKGVLPVAAAGNTFGGLGNQPQRPATDPHVISVSAVDNNDLVADFATRNRRVDITAPGDRIYSPFVDPGAGSGSVTEWAQNSGTSFSTPMVSAAATWISQARPNLDARRIGRLLTATANDLGTPGRDPLYGEGLLDIGSALTAKAPPADPREPNDDIDWVNGKLLPGRAGFVWRPGRRRAGTVVATLSRTKDWADVYRVLIAPRRRVLITTRQLQGDVALKVFRPTAKTIRRGGGQLIVRSDKARPATEGVLVRNAKRRPQVVYVAVTVSPRWTDEYVRYRLAAAGR